MFVVLKMMVVSSVLDSGAKFCSISPSQELALLVVHIIGMSHVSKFLLLYYISVHSIGTSHVSKFLPLCYSSFISLGHPICRNSYFYVILSFISLGHPMYRNSYFYAIARSYHWDIPYVEIVIFMLYFVHIIGTSHVSKFLLLCYISFISTEHPIWQNSYFYVISHSYFQDISCVEILTFMLYLVHIIGRSNMSKFLLLYYIPFVSLGHPMCQNSYFYDTSCSYHRNIPCV